MFCPKCKSILIAKNGKLICEECGPVQGSSKISEKNTGKKKEIHMVKEEYETLPKTKEECSKCGNREAYYWVVQTRAADEAPTRFYRCTKCRHSWREYS